ncbi:MAG: histidine phosphatase family protein, partial [Caulobacteraceae bacterium]
TRRRSIETARALCGEGRFSEDEALVEAPLPPPNFPSWIRLPPRAWGIIARLWWWFLDHHEGGECRAEAQARADAVADRLCDLARVEGDILVVAHGFFNTMIGRSLRARGWRCTRGEGFGYWAARRFERAADADRRPSTLGG